MDGDKASRFVSSLVKSIQALCNGYIDFSSSIEVIGHIHLNIDRSVKLDYVLTEEVSKSVSEGATVFASHSYHSQPPSSVSLKSAADTSNRNRHKQSATVSQEDEDPLGFRSLPPDVHSTPSKSDSYSHKRGLSHYNENSESSQTGSYVDTSDQVSGKLDHRQRLGLSQEPLDRRRRSAPLQSQFHNSPSPAAKRSRQNDSSAEQDPHNFEVIEIKEEPDDEPAVFFGNSSSHMAAGQDMPTPDFSNVVMESLDRVGQVEGTNLIGSGDGGPMQQQQPFPVMMHANSGMAASSASSLPGPSLSDPQAQSLASTSGSEVEAVPPVGAPRTEQPSRAAGPPEGPSLPCKAQKHYLQRIPRELGRGALPSPLRGSQAALLLQPCRACREEGFGKVSPFFCPVCPGRPAFCCTRDCFVGYHKRMGYALLSVPSANVPKKTSPQAHSFQLRSFKYL